MILYYTIVVMVCVVLIGCVFFFVKQKTAYEMRISDWSSDVCSSDLEKKAFSPLVIMRWISGVKGSREINEYYLQMVNEMINQNLWDSCLSKHPELLYIDRKSVV